MDCPKHLAVRLRAGECVLCLKNEVEKLELAQTLLSNRILDMVTKEDVAKLRTHCNRWREALELAIKELHHYVGCDPDCEKNYHVALKAGE